MADREGRAARHLAEDGEGQARAGDRHLSRSAIRWPMRLLSAMVVLGFAFSAAAQEPAPSPQPSVPVQASPTPAPLPDAPTLTLRSRGRSSRPDGVALARGAHALHLRRSDRARGHRAVAVERDLCFCDGISAEHRRFRPPGQALGHRAGAGGCRRGGVGGWLRDVGRRARLATSYPRRARRRSRPRPLHRRHRGRRDRAGRRRRQLLLRLLRIISIRTIEPSRRCPPRSVEQRCARREPCSIQSIRRG